MEIHAENRGRIGEWVYRDTGSQWYVIVSGRKLVRVSFCI